MKNHNDFQPYPTFPIFSYILEDEKQTAGKKNTVSIFIFQNWMLIFTTLFPLGKTPTFSSPRNPNHSSLPAIRNHPCRCRTVVVSSAGCSLTKKMLERNREVIEYCCVYRVFMYWVCVLQQLAIFRCDDWFKSAVF